MIYLQLFFAFLQIGALSFGGGYAAMPLIQAQAIDKYHWISIPCCTEEGTLKPIAEIHQAICRHLHIQPAKSMV